MDTLYGGLLGLSFWGYVLVTFVMVQLTIMAVTLYLHRDQAHRSLDLHPALRHVFRFWIWATSSMLTREWVAVHRKHHAHVETENDPHSPKVVGLRRVLLQGAELYRAETRNDDTLEQYGRGTPNDWIERKLYSRYRNLGITALVVTDLLLFGVPGIIIIAVQLISMPLFAAGVINGVGHHTGYRNFESEDASTNIVPLAVLLGGEELHNNHHAFPSSAKFSVRPWEFDIGWMYIKLFSWLGLARVKRVAPKPVVVPGRRHIDLETARAIVLNRMHVLRDYTRKVTLPVLRAELQRRAASLPRLRIRKLLVRSPALLDEQASAHLKELLDRHETLATVVEFRERLRALWSGAATTNERLIAHLKEWCAQAEASGIRVLQEFAGALRGYAVAPVRV